MATEQNKHYTLEEKAQLEERGRRGRGAIWGRYLLPKPWTPSTAVAAPQVAGADSNSLSFNLGRERKLATKIG